MWNHKLGKQGNVERLEDALSRTQSQTFQNQIDILEAEANMVEAVIDEYYAVIGEEREDV